MRTAIRVLALLSVPVMFSLCCMAQTAAKEATGSVSGRVTIGGKGAAGITVTATSTSSPIENRTVSKATTDDEGNYRLTGLPAGSFNIMPVAKAFALGKGGRVSKQSRQSIIVAEGESITKIDFALVRGGVVTGRITDADGRPIIGERVNVVLKDARDAGREMDFFEGLRNRTDDRGIYRVYGLAPGSYTVSVGRDPSIGDGGGGMGFGRSQYLRTFYPGVQEESKAAVLEISEGKELSNIDITPGTAARGFAVSGRVVDAASGQPVTNVYIAYSPYDETKQQLGDMNFTPSQPDANGRFRLDGVRPGHYAAFTLSLGQENGSYSEPAPFEVSDGDVTGVEIKVRRGATINGVAVIENNSDPAVAAILHGIVLYASVDREGLQAPSFAIGKINPDGSFSFSGLAPGKVRMAIQGYPAPPKGLTLLRTQLDGLDRPEGIEVTAGAQITGVRLVFGYGSGSIRGDVKVEGGTLPEGSGFHLTLSSSDGNTHQYGRFVQVDARGRFVVEDIPPGTYRLALSVTPVDRLPTGSVEPLVRSVAVANGVETKVTLVVQLTPKK